LSSRTIQVNREFDESSTIWVATRTRSRERRERKNRVNADLIALVIRKTSTNTVFSERIEVKEHSHKLTASLRMPQQRIRGNEASCNSNYAVQSKPEHKFGFTTKHFVKPALVVKSQQ